MARKNMPPGPGRPKGMPNKLTVALKEALMEPFDAEAFKEWAKKEENLYYVHILTKLLPKDINITREIKTMDDLTEDEKRSILSDLQAKYDRLSMKSDKDNEPNG